MDRDFVKKVGLQGGIIAVCVIAAYMIGLQTDAAMASSMAFATLTLARLLHGFNCRGEHSLAKIGFKNNRASLGAFLIGFVLVICVLFVPAIMQAFSVSVITAPVFGIIVLLAALPTIFIQLFRMAKRI